MPGATVATTLNSHATPVPIAISVNMFRCMVRTEVQPRWKKGQPAHSTTGVANTSWTHAEVRGDDEVVQCGEQVPAHPEDEDRDGQHDTDPEPAGHVDELCVRAGVGGDQDRFQRHPADGARTGSGLPDLGVHRARVLRDLSPGRNLGRAGSRGSPVPGRARRTRSGSASNFAWQPAEQKWNVSPSCTAVSVLVAGFTSMPHTGSLTVGVGRASWWVG